MYTFPPASCEPSELSLDRSQPTDGPKTIGGLMLKHLASFPDVYAGLTIYSYRQEILAMEGNVVRSDRAQLAA